MRGREKEMRKERREKVADVAMQVTLSQGAKCKNANENKCGYSGYTRTCAHVHTDCVDTISSDSLFFTYCLVLIHL